MPKPISEMTDEEIAALSAEELEALKAGDEQGGEGGEEEEGSEEEGASEGEGEEEEGEGAADDGDDAAALKALLEQEGDDGDEDRMVPYKRLKELAGDNRDLRTILKSMIASGQQQAPQQQAPEPDPEPVAPVYDFKAKAREMAKLASEGRSDEAETLAEEIETQRRLAMDFEIAAAERRAETNALRRTNAEFTKRALETAQSEIYKDYPFLDNTAKEANEAAIMAVNQKAKLLIGEGVAPAAALKQAADTIVGQLRKLMGVADPKRGKKEEAPAAMDPRTKAAIERGLGFRQPGNGQKGVGARLPSTGKIDVSKLSDKDIDKLGEKGLRSLMGYDDIPGEG